MAKRVAFAWVTIWYDFDTEQEAINFIRKNRTGKGWLVEEVAVKNNDYWTVEVKKPYNKKYNPGW